MIDAVAAARRRQVLAVLQDRTAPVPERELATCIAAIEGEKPPVEVTSEEVASIRTDLHHVHLPRLEAASLVERDADGATVTTTGHPALDDPSFQQLVGADADDWDAVVASIASRRRRTVLAVLADREEPMACEDLAAAVHRRGRHVDHPSTAVEDVRASLHHSHLPKLDDAGLVSYDADEGTAVYEGHPRLPTEWFERAPEESPRFAVAAARKLSDV